jgi:hypothetical protein
MKENQEEREDPRTENVNKLPINKGVELMLRRVKGEPKKQGFKFSKLFSLHKRQFFFNIEFSWGDLE